eukprot:TRINITY_DN54763_c0_g1_i1.p1 TRINITY_DN54763_c0_g1~~TRINITY_DN54763_c0_g1_i1.p1  ORF type:complete len:407 (+),score=87.28 TRINITY_DN54763_c0_g1_i1:65-1285(+)
MQRVAMEVEDVELLTASGEEPSVPRTLPSPRKLAVIVAGLFGFVAVAGLVAATYGSNTLHTPRQLLESSQMIDEATANVMAFHPHAKDQVRVRALVTKGLAKISKRLAENPEMAARLDSIKLTTAQKRDVLRSVANMRNPAVQKLGQRVANALSQGYSEGQEGVGRRFMDMLKTDKEVLRSLHDNAFPASAHKLTSEDIYLDTERMRIMKELPRALEMHSDPKADSSRRLADATDIASLSKGMLTGEHADSMAIKFEEALGIFAGLVEQARVALDQIDQVGEDYGWNSKIPYQAKSLVGGLAFVTECLDCVQRADSNEVKLVMCPMKYASAATDFLEALDNVMGLQNGHFWGDSKASTSLPTNGQASGWSAPQQQQTASNNWNSAQQANPWGAPAPAPGSAPTGFR